MTQKHHIKIELEDELYKILQEIKERHGILHNTEGLRLCIKTAHKQLLKKEVEVPA